MVGSAESEILVSVVIPTYNRSKLLVRAIESVALQNFPGKLEIVVADDGSTDDTAAVIAQLGQKYPYIRYIRNPKNGGESSARNLGTRNAVGRYIAYLDSDDEWLPGKLNIQFYHLEKEGADGKPIDASVTGYYLVDADGTRERSTNWFPRKSFTSENLLKYGCAMSFGSAGMVRRSVFAAIGYFDETLPIFVDVEWLCRFADHGFQMGAIPEPLALYYKAPMRRGEFLEKGVTAFKAKLKQSNKAFPLLVQSQIESQFYNYVSHSYAVNGPKSKFILTRSLYFLLNPFRSPGDYYSFFATLIRYLGDALFPGRKGLRKG